MRILLIGGGDLSKQVLHSVNTYDKDSIVVGFVDDFAQLNEIRFGIHCLGSIIDLPMLHIKNVFDKAFLCIGYGHLFARKQIFESLSNKIPFYTFIHPTAFIDDSAEIGEGCFIGPCTIIEQHVSINNNVFIYGGSNISHDTKIDSNSFIAPSVVIAGFAYIGQCCFIGLRSAIIERVRIGDNIKIGAGSLVLKDLSESGTYIGSPVQKQ